MGTGEGAGSAARQRHRASYDSVIRLCGQGLPAGELFTRLSGQLRKVIAFRTAGWTLFDPMTLLPMPGLLLEAGHDRVSQIICNEYFGPDVVKFRELAHAPLTALMLGQLRANTTGPAAEMARQPPASQA